MSGLLGEIGTIEWSRRTNGILGRGEKARFLAAVVPADVDGCCRGFWPTGSGGAGPAPTPHR